MGMNNLENLLACLEQGSNEVSVDPAIGEQAMRSLGRMMDFNRRS
jgi:quinolinate synthase